MITNVSGVIERIADDKFGNDKFMRYVLRTPGCRVHFYGDYSKHNLKVGDDVTIRGVGELPKHSFGNRLQRGIPTFPYTTFGEVEVIKVGK
jgi:hypothetical protein